MKRSIDVARKTGETDIEMFLNLDGTGQYEVRTDCGFMKHMLELFARHGGFDLNIRCVGDHYVDDHHAVEDMGIVLGKGFKEAFGDNRGIRRYGSMLSRDLRHRARQGVLPRAHPRDGPDAAHQADQRREHAPHHRSHLQGCGKGAQRSRRSRRGRDSVHQRAFIRIALPARRASVRRKT